MNIKKEIQQRYLNKTKTFNIKVNCADNKFLYCNEYILTDRSNYFNALFSGEFKEKNIIEVNLQEYDADVVALYLYILDKYDYSIVTFQDVIKLEKLFDFTDCDIKYYLSKKVLDEIGNEIDTILKDKNTLIYLIRLLYKIIKNKKYENCVEEYNYVYKIYTYIKNLPEETIISLIKELDTIDYVLFISNGHTITFVKYYLIWLKFDITDEKILDIINEKYVKLAPNNNFYNKNTKDRIINLLCYLHNLTNNDKIKNQIVEKIKTFLIIDND